MSTKFDVLVKVFTNHKNLKYFMFIKQLNKRQSKWVQFLADFNFVIIYLLEKFNEKANALTKRIDNVLNKKNNRQKQQFQTLLLVDQFDKSLFAIELTLVFETNRLQLMQKMHDQLAFNYLEINKTIKLLKRNYTWSRLTQDVKQYIRNCHICKRTKAFKKKYQELLHSLFVLNRF